MLFFCQALFSIVLFLHIGNSIHNWILCISVLLVDLCTVPLFGDGGRTGIVFLCTITCIRVVRAYRYILPALRILHSNPRSAPQKHRKFTNSVSIEPKADTNIAKVRFEVPQYCSALSRCFASGLVPVLNPWPWTMYLLRVWRPCPNLSKPQSFRAAVACQKRSGA